MSRAISQIVCLINIIKLWNGSSQRAVQSNDIRVSTFRIDSDVLAKRTHLKDSIAGEVNLYPNQVVRAERYQFNDTVLYHLTYLDPSKVYIVKISYPASIPSSFHLEKIDSYMEPSLSNIRGRRLNTEIFPVTFEGTDSAKGLVQKDVLIHIMREGVLPIGGKGPTYCIYDIALDELLFGFLPFATIYLIIWAVFLLLLLRVFVWNHVLRKITLKTDDKILAKKISTQPKGINTHQSKDPYQNGTKDQ
uniref:AlNc14C197G8590 protein n=1 Tax=Albugo laibachii Nc14 TaxID=890382 RepID=F0WQA9_9STRA|nr:AlNc14C197G8590 [Albugo laibachii Nc14]|eukprot:CCA23517.1 AlNc14C197G8590 [Albugo laibachii Nc14]